MKSMDRAYRNNVITEQEREEFEANGFLIIENALSPALVKRLTNVANELSTEYKEWTSNGGKTSAVDLNGMSHERERTIREHDSYSIRGCIAKRRALLDLVDWPAILPKVWGILGWNIQLYSSRIIITPSLPASTPVPPMLAWHQDSGRLNVELETAPRPRISVKVAYYLTDATQPGRGNMFVVPGSHINNEMPDCVIGDSEIMPRGAIPLLIPAGSAVIFDRRIWHAPSPNHSNVTRKVIICGYSYRWLRPRDRMDVGDVLADSNPIRRQLLGACETELGYSSPSKADVPLREWVVRTQSGPPGLI